jgi:hypothetical protein
LLNLLRVLLVSLVGSCLYISAILASTFVVGPLTRRIFDPRRPLRSHLANVVGDATAVFLIHDCVVSVLYGLAVNRWAAAVGPFCVWSALRCMALLPSVRRVLSGRVDRLVLAANREHAALLIGYPASIVLALLAVRK